MLVGNGGFDENVFPSFGDLQPTSGVEFRLLFFLAGTFGGNDFIFLVEPAWIPYCQQLIERQEEVL